MSVFDDFSATLNATMESFTEKPLDDDAALAKMREKHPDGTDDDLRRFLGATGNNDVAAASKSYLACVAWRGQTLPVEPGSVCSVPDWIVIDGHARDVLHRAWVAH